MLKVVWCEEHCNNLNNFFFHYKKRLWNGEVPWMLKVIHATINANTEPLCLKGYLYWKIVFCTKKKIYILRTVHWNILYGIQNGSSMASPLWNFICKSVRADISIVVQHLMPHCLGILGLHSQTQPVAHGFRLKSIGSQMLCWVESWNLVRIRARTSGREATGAT